VSEFWKFKPQPQDRQLMVRPNTWSGISPHNIPVVNITQLTTNEMSRLISLAPYLKENERASYKTATSYTNENSETETLSLVKGINLSRTGEKSPNP
jgi:hypothetical protein